MIKSLLGAIRSPNETYTPSRVEMDVTQLTFGQLKYLRFIQDHPGFIQESCMLAESFRFIQVKWRFCRSIEVVFSECVCVVVWSNGFIALPAQNQLCTLKSEVRFPCIGWSDVRMDESRCPGELKPHFDPCSNYRSTFVRLLLLLLHTRQPVKHAK